MKKLKLKTAAVLVIACGTLLSACGEKPPEIEEASIGINLINQTKDIVNQANSEADIANDLINNMP